MNVYAPAVDGHPTAVSQNELDAMAMVTNDHDGALATSNVPVRFILVSGSQAAPLKLENVIIHTIKDGGMDQMGFPKPCWLSSKPA
jgi:hypothetical protein